MAFFSFSLLDLFMIGIPLIAYIIYTISLLLNKRNENSKSPPEPPGSWPLLGHLHLLAGPELPHRTLASIADAHGPLVALRLGSRRALVASDRSAAVECFSAAAFSSRPRTIAARHMGYDQAMFGLAPAAGEYWRRIRKLAVAELLSPRRLEEHGGGRRAEIARSVRELHHGQRQSGTVVDMSRWFSEVTMATTTKMLAGDRGERGSQRWVFGRFMAAMGVFMARDYVPAIGWAVDWAVRGRRCVAEMKEAGAEIDGLLTQWVAEHRRTKGVHDDDFLDVMLRALDDDHHGILTHHLDADTVLKATCLSLILGSNDTTSVTLTWTLSLLLNHPNTLQQVRAELDSQVGCDRQVDEADVKRLSYLQAVVKEAMRVHPSLPLSAPLEAAADCHVAGFRIPAGTRLIVNIWKIHRDPRVWADPDEFRPERFLGNGVGFKGTGFEYMPFGAGKRVCPGIGFALSVVHLTLARLVHGFEIETADGGPVDMTESPGLACAKAIPLEVKLTPRLPPEIYGS